MFQGEFIDGIAAIADRFEGFVLDQWGVLHNGSTPYPGAVELVAELARRNKKMVLLSNSGRRAEHNALQLREIGYNPANFAGIVTSGEVCWQALDQGGSFLGEMGKRCLLIARTGDTSPVEGLSLELVDEPDAADFVFLSWLERSPEKLALLDEVLEQGPKRDLPMLCANPDRVAPVAGGLIEAPGSVAARYENAGGRVIYIGKPHRPIYTALLNYLEGFDLQEIVCVGDSIEHDIKGAFDMGLKSCLIAGGIHEDELGPERSQAYRVKALEKFAAKYAAVPDFVAPAFRWDGGR